MLTRLVGSAIVVAVGLIAILVGGPIYAIVLISVCAVGYHEYLGLACRITPGPWPRRIGVVGYPVIAALGGAAFVKAGDIALFGIVALAVAAPLVLAFPISASPGAFAGWALTAAGSLYLGLPAFAAIDLRSLIGTIDGTWLSAIADGLAIAWQPHPRGAAWVLTVVLATWAGDTCAYLSGRQVGRHALAARLSPNKTVEGAVGGLVGSAVVSLLTVTGFGLGAWWLGIVIGVFLAIAGQLGDLSESLLKRQAGVKDSGTVIPGHGGLLDRIDALLFAFPTGYVLAVAVERISR